MENEELETGELDSQEDNTSENENNDVDTLLAQKKHFREKFEKEKQNKEQALKELEELKKNPKNVEKETPKNSGMDLKDIRALNDVPDEDVDEVIDFAKFKGISIAESKKHPMIQTLLKTKAEERKTAEATNTTSTRRSSSKVSDEDLLDKLSKNEVPEEDLDKAIAARLERKKKGN